MNFYHAASSSASPGGLMTSSVSRSSRANAAFDGSAAYACASRPASRRISSGASRDRSNVRPLDADHDRWRIAVSHDEDPWNDPAGKRLVELFEAFPERGPVRGRIIGEHKVNREVRFWQKPTRGW
jgi:hypothetical protein